MAFHIVYGSRGDLTGATRVLTRTSAYPETRWPLMHMIADEMRTGERYIDTIGHFEGPLSPETAMNILAMRSAPAADAPVGHFPFEALRPENVASRSDFVRSLRFGSKAEDLFPSIGWPENPVSLKQGMYKHGTIALPQDYVFFPLTLGWLRQFEGFIFQRWGKQQLLRKEVFKDPLTLSIEDCSTLLQRLNVFAKPQGFILSLPSYPMFEALLPADLEFEDIEESPFGVFQRLMGRTRVLHYLREVLSVAVVPTYSSYDEKGFFRDRTKEMRTDLNPRREMRRYSNPDFRYIALTNPGEEIIYSAGKAVPNSTVIIQRSVF